MIKKKIALLLILVMLGTLVGCWDAIEIDERGYVISLGIDKYEAPDPETTEEEHHGEEDTVEATAHAPKAAPRNRYSFTYIIPNVEFLIGQSDNPNILYNTVGENLYSASRILTTRFNKQIFFGHMKALIIGEEVARDSKLFREVLDAIERDPFISRRVSVAIAPGPQGARSILEVEPQVNPLTGQFIAELFRNKDRSPRSGGGIIGDVLADLHRWGNTVIPRVIPGEEDIKVAGSALIKNYKMIGWLGEIETRAVEIIRGTARPGGLTVEHETQGDEHHHIVPIDLVYIGRKFHLAEDSNEIKINIEIRAEGEIQQYFFDPEEDLLDPEIIRELEDLICKQLEEELNFTIVKLQEEFQLDVLRIDHYLSRYHPRLWEEIEEDWEEVFSNADITANVDTKIRRVGLTK